MVFVASKQEGVFIVPQARAVTQSSILLWSSPKDYMYPNLVAFHDKPGEVISDLFQPVSHQDILYTFIMYLQYGFEIFSPLPIQIPKDFPKSIFF